jgi:hypothetical protein
LAKKKQQAKKPIDEQKQAEKRTRREERKVAEAKAKKLAQRKKRIRTATMVGIAVLVVGVAGFFIADKATAEELPGVSMEFNEGRGHVDSGTAVHYPTATPTSGTHAEGSPRCGILDQQIPNEFAVHSLEHGAVVIWYQPTLDDATVSELRDIVNRFDHHVILSPNAEMSDPVVATAWLRLKAYDGADPEIEEFISVYRERGPERVPCNY